MPTHAAFDATTLAYQVNGAGTPVVCLGGGPMQDSSYLGDLGGLSARLRLILPDYRGTGRSQTPVDISSYRCDRLVDDVVALREHLGLDRINLLAHCAGANVAVLYAARYPGHLGKLALVTPSTMAIGVTAGSDVRRQIVRMRDNEPWFAPASAAFERVQLGRATAEDWAAITPFTYGRWDAAAQAHNTEGERTRNEEAAAVFGADGAYRPAATRAALAGVDTPVLLVAGEVDVAAPPAVVAEYADVFAGATFVTQPRAGHFPWLDDPVWFTETVAAFLD